MLRSFRAFLADGDRLDLCGSTVSGRCSRRKCCSDMKIASLLCAFLAAVILSGGDDLPAQFEKTPQAKAAGGKSSAVRSAIDKSEIDQTVVDSALITVIEQAE